MDLASRYVAHNLTKIQHLLVAHYYPSAAILGVGVSTSCRTEPRLSLEILGVSSIHSKGDIKQLWVIAARSHLNT